MDKFIDNGVTLEVFILKSVPEASSVGSNPPLAKLLNVNVGVDFSIVTSPFTSKLSPTVKFPLSFRIPPLNTAPACTYSDVPAPAA